MKRDIRFIYFIFLGLFSPVLYAENYMERPLLLKGLKADLLSHGGLKNISPLYQPKNKLNILLKNSSVQVNDLQKALEEGADINIHDQKGNTPLHNAVLLQKPELVEFLLRHKASKFAVNNEEKTPLQLAQELNNRPLFGIINKRQSDTIVNLLSSPELTAKKVPVYYLEDRFRRLPEGLENLAVKQGRWAYKMTHPQGLGLLPGQRNKFNELLKNPSITLYDLQKALLEGADVNIKDEHGNTPLHRAVLLQRPDVVRFFLSNKADYQVLNNDKKTPLMMVIESGDPQLFQLFVQNNPLRDEEKKKFIRYGINTKNEKFLKNLIFLLQDYYGPYAENEKLINAYLYNQKLYDELAEERIIAALYTNSTFPIRLLEDLEFNFIAWGNKIMKWAKIPYNFLSRILEEKIHTVATQMPSSQEKISKEEERSILESTLLKDISLSHATSAIFSYQLLKTLGFAYIKLVNDALEAQGNSFLNYLLMQAQVAKDSHFLLKALSYNEDIYGPLSMSKPLVEAFLHDKVLFKKMSEEYLKTFLEKHDEYVLNLLNFLHFNFDEEISDRAFDAVKYNQINFLELLLPVLKSPLNKQGKSLLDVALSNGREEVALLLIKKGIWNKNARDEFLHKASFLGLKKVVNALLQEGANPLVGKFPNDNAFMRAVESGNISTVQIFLRKHKSQIQDTLQPALYNALSHYRKDLAQVLINAGANINIVDEKGNTLLHKALLQEDYRLVNLLLDLGIKVSGIRSNVQGQTPLGIVLLRNSPQDRIIEERLERYGAEATHKERGALTYATSKEFVTEHIPAMARSFGRAYKGVFGY